MFSTCSPVENRSNPLTLQLPFPSTSSSANGLIQVRQKTQVAESDPNFHLATKRVKFTFSRKKKKLFWVFVQSWKTEQKNGSTNIKTYHIVSKCIKTKTVIKMYINDVGTSSPLFLALPWFFSVKGHMNPEHLLKHSRVRVVEGMKKIHHPFQFLRDFQVSPTQTNRMVNIYHISITISIKITWNHDNITQTLLDPISDQRREYAP